MNSKGIVAIPKSKAFSICMKCLCKSKKIVRISIPDLGYGSGFDGMGTQIHLCPKCLRTSNPRIWNLKVVRGEYSKEYENESQMFEYINNLPVQSKELVFNTYAHGWAVNYTMEPQDWIDFQLNELPHEKCKKYGLCSPEEYKAYQERFPTCQHPYIRVYQDGSCGCWCALHHAHGEYGQKCGINTYGECYLCKDYMKRTSEIRDIADTDANDYELYIRMKMYQESLVEKFSQRDIC